MRDYSDVNNTTECDLRMQKLQCTIHGIVFQYGQVQEMVAKERHLQLIIDADKFERQHHESCSSSWFVVSEAVLRKEVEVDVLIVVMLGRWRLFGKMVCKYWFNIRGGMKREDLQWAVKVRIISCTPYTNSSIWIRTLHIQLNAQRPTPNCRSLAVDTCQLGLIAPWMTDSSFLESARGGCVECIDCEAEGFLG